MLLISSPAKAWEEIRFNTDRRAVFTEFVYPMIGLCGLSEFIGSMLEYGWSGPQSFQLAMTQCCAVAVALFGGYFLAAFAINHLGVRLFGLKNDILLAQQLAGYTLVVTFLISIVTGMLPDFTVIGWLLCFYLVYVAWEGVSALYEMKENKKVGFTILASALLIFCPAIIQVVFNKLTVILN